MKDIKNSPIKDILKNSLISESLSHAYLFFGQKSILERQTEILDRTTQSNKADLVLVSSQGNIFYEISELDETRESEPIAIGVVNYGKSIAPFVEVKLIPGTFRAVGVHYRGWEIKELKSLEYNATFFRISLNYLVEELIPGKYNLTFSITCPYCMQKYKEENIPICIRTGYQKMAEECGENWGN